MNNKGFTLMEILIVVSLLGLLTGFGSVTVKEQIDKTNDARRKSDIYKLRGVLEHYYNDTDCYPAKTDWSTIECGSSTGFLSQYIGKVPCDPTLKTPYFYEQIDAGGNSCEGSCRVCPGYRLMAVLTRPSDADITAVGCEPTGCGVIDTNNRKPNWGIAMGSSVPVPGFVPGQGQDTGHTDKHDCKHSKDPECATPTPTYSEPVLTPIPTLKPILPTISPSVTPKPTPSLIVDACLEAPNPEPPPPPYTTKSYDTGNCGSLQSDFTNLIYYENGLEWYKWENGGYPDCGCTSWAKTEECLRNKISQYTSTLPKSTSYPYIYRPYNSVSGKYQSYCLSAPYTGCPISNYSCPLTGIPNYNLYRKGRGEIIWRPNGNPLPQNEKTANDNRRKQDLAAIKSAFEQYKNDHGFYPQVSYENSPGTILYVKNQLEPAYLNPMPFIVGTEFGYSITEWGKDANGKFNHFCISSYMDDSSNCGNYCNSWNPFYNAYYCYGVGN
jgi:prepilin-type N-terminal cleavage/methylation domain-containing protein